MSDRVGAEGLQCRQCPNEMATDIIPFCTVCLHNGIDDELRHLLPPNASIVEDDEEQDPKETTEQSGLGGFA